MRTLSEIIAENARNLGDKPCIILPTGEASLSYRQLDTQATQFAGFLKGLEKPERRTSPTGADFTTG